MAKKDKKNGLPKRIAGVKVPKELRRMSGSMLTLAHTPIVRQVIASGLVAAAAAIVAVEEGTDPKKRKIAKHMLGNLADAGAHGANDTARAIGAAVTAAMEKWLGGALHWEQADEEDGKPSTAH